MGHDCLNVPYAFWPTIQVPYSTHCHFFVQSQHLTVVRNRIAERYIFNHNIETKISTILILIWNTKYIKMQSHTQASKSKWLVGSSSKSRWGLMKSARAKAIRIRQPPEKSLHFFSCMALLKPKPLRI